MLQVAETRHSNISNILYCQHKLQHYRKKNITFLSRCRGLYFLSRIAQNPKKLDEIWKFNIAENLHAFLKEVTFHKYSD